MAKKSFRWGIPILDEGFVPVYNFMLRNYHKTGATREEFLCILHLAAYHYESERGEARPAMDTIAEEMGYKHKNSVYRLCQSLRAKGLLKMQKRKGKTSIYDVSSFSKIVLEKFLEGQKDDTSEGVTLQGDTSVTTQGDTVSQPIVTEEEKKQEKTSNKTNGATRPRDLLFDAILEGAYGVKADSEEGTVIAKEKGSSIGKVAATLKKLGKTPADVQYVVGEWRAWADSRPTIWQLQEKAMQNNKPVTVPQRTDAEIAVQAAELKAEMERQGG